MQIISRTGNMPLHKLATSQVSPKLLPKV